MSARRAPHWVIDEVVPQIHQLQLERHGGAPGIRDEGLLSSALNRPKNLYTYGQSELFSLAASYAYGLVKNHPFFDGNKRVAFVVMSLFLELNGHQLTAGQDEAAEAIIAVASSEWSESELADWLRRSTERLPH